MTKLVPYILTLTLTIACSDRPAVSAEDTLQSAVTQDLPIASEGYVLKNAFPELSFSRPLFLLQIPAPGDLLLVAEQGGKIFSFSRSDATEKTLFLDLSDRILSAGNEQGLLGVALAPDFEQSGWVYVNYTAPNPNRTVISRFQADPQTLLIDRDVEKVLLEIDQPFSNHNGGMLAFGPDGYLYIGVGDGGSGGDPHGHGQNTHTLLGTILRIEPTQEGYNIPAGNLFRDNPSEGKAEIWAWGLRNPWRFSFDAATGNLWAGDVGQNAFEEINIVENGKNYGWNSCEGFHSYPTTSTPCPASFAPPVHEYGRSEGRSITGGYVYRGQNLPGLIGHYIYADFVSRKVWALNVETQQNRLLLTASEPIASFGQDQSGELYLLGFGGHVLTLEDSP